jgi:hypothetical protein
MVQVQYNGYVAPEFMGVFHSALGHVFKKVLVGVFPRARGHLENHRGPGFHAGLDNGLKLLHIIEVIGRKGIAALDGFLEKFFGIY